MMLVVLLVLVSSNQVVIGSDDGNFAEVPRSQTVLEGSTAVFRCTPTSPNAHDVFWTLNGRRVGANPPPEVTPSIIRENGRFVDILTINSSRMYNNSEVVCAAEVEMGLVSTDPAILTVLPRFPPRNLRPIAPGPGFVLAPMSQNVTVGTTVHFSCQHTNGDVIWRINGESVSQYPAASFSGEGGLNTLTIRSAPANYDGAVISCLVFFGDSDRELARQAILRLQGQLDAVSDLHVDRISSTLSWEPPFSQDLTGIEPDIVYCVDIYNITCGRRDLIISDCNVTEPSYTSDVIAPHGYIYEYIVTPRSNVLGSQNGTSSQPLTERFPMFSDTINERSSMQSVQIVFTNPEPTRPLPTSIALSLASVDGLGDHQHNTTNITQEGDLLVLDVPGLPRNRVWNCTVLAYGCKKNKLLNGVELSTHSVQNISITSYPGRIGVTGDFIEDSTASGVLITVVNETSTQHHIITKESDQNELEGAISGLASGQYTVSVFVVDKDGVPFIRVATKPRKVFVEHEDGSSVEIRPPAITYELQTTSTGVCITCTFLDSSSTGCVIVVYQPISQLSSSGLSNIVLTRKFSRSGDTAYGCVSADLRKYQIGVIDGQLVLPRGSRSVCTGCIVGAVLAVVFCAVSISILIPVLVIYGKKKGKQLLFRRMVTEASVSNMEEGSDGCTCSEKNVGEDIPPSKPIQIEVTPGENEPLIQQIDNGPTESNEPQQRSHIPQTPPISPPTSSPVIPQAAVTGSTGETVEPTKTVYDEVEHQPNPGFPAPPQGDEPQYSTVNKFKNPQGLVYACHLVEPPSTTTEQVILEDSTKTTSQYSEIIHPPNCQEKTGTTTTTTLNDKPERPTSPFVPSITTPCTVDNLLPLLYSIASKWQSLGEALSLDEDDLDIINTNNETDEACLQDMLEFYVEKSDSQHTWEEMTTALRKVDEETIAEKIQDLHIEPYMNPVPGQPEETQDTESSPRYNATTPDITMANEDSEEWLNGAELKPKDDTKTVSEERVNMHYTESTPVDIEVIVSNDEATLLNVAVQNNQVERNEDSDKEVRMESAQSVISTPEELIQVEQTEELSESGEVQDEMTESANHSIQESMSYGTTIISGGGAQHLVCQSKFKPVAQSTPHKRRPNSGSEECSLDQSSDASDDSASMIVQSSVSYKCKAGNEIAKSPTCYVFNPKAESDAIDHTSSQPVIRKDMCESQVPDGDSAYHDTCSIPGDLESCSSLNEPYSDFSDLGNQHVDPKTLPVKTAEKMVSGYESTSTNNSFDGGGVSLSTMFPNETVPMENHPQVQLFFNTNGSDGGLLVLPQKLNGNEGR